MLSFSQKDRPVLQISALTNFSKVRNIRSTAGPAPLACQLFGSHMLLIQNFKFQLERPSGSPDIRANKFFESLQYQEYSWTCTFRVQPLRISHMLLMRNFKFQLERPSRSPDIHANKFFERFKYQEYSRTSSIHVPLPRTSYAPDTKFQVLARKTISFSRYPH